MFSFVVGILFLTTSCNKNNNDDDNDTNKSITDLVISDNFDWSTSESSNFKLRALDNTGNPISGANVRVYSDNPEEGGSLMVNGVTDDNGEFVVDYEVPSYYDSIYVETNYIGVVSPGMTELVNGGFNLVVGGIPVPPQKNSSVGVKSVVANYTYLGDYNSYGVPLYLEPENDVITQDLLDDINNTLPEQEPLTESHPEYLLPDWDYNIDIVEACDVWITFVHEGAGYKNSLGFYTYETGNAPQNPDDIEEIKIIFPNISYQGSGGGLYSGNKVYIGQYEANTTISFALMANGWKNGAVTDGYWVVYSNPELNPESDAELKQHMVLLNDNSRDLLLLGIEDIRRDKSGCDQDFNDAIFYVTANPIEAIDQSQFPIIDYTGSDSDGDGIPDNVDDYPNNGQLAFDNFFFNEGSFGTLAYEDMWPNIGDYDFNDAVVDYNFNQITNAQNQLVEIQGTLILKAHGAYFHNGFGIELPFDKILVESVTGDLSLNNGIVSVDDRNLENNQTKPVVIVWDDAYDVLPQVGGGVGVNTTPGIPFEVPDTINLSIKLTQPLNLSEAGIPPYNPFIFVDGQRDVEIHLVDNEPTDLANMAIFDTDSDDSDPAAGRYYRTEGNLPWAINVIEQFEYPNEKAEVTSAYLKFGDWAESDGTLFNDWWKNEPDYRNSDNIYVADE